MKFFHAHFSPFTGTLFNFFHGHQIQFHGWNFKKIFTGTFFFTDTFSDFFHGWLCFFHGEKNTVYSCIDIIRGIKKYGSFDSKCTYY